MSGKPALGQESSPSVPNPSPAVSLEVGGYMANDPLDQATLAVVAHGLLNSVAVIQAAAATIQISNGRVGVTDIERWAARIQHHAQVIDDGLHTIVHGAPADALAALDRLNRRAV